MKYATTASEHPNEIGKHAHKLQSHTFRHVQRRNKFLLQPKKYYLFGFVIALTHCQVRATQHSAHGFITSTAMFDPIFELHDSMKRHSLRIVRVPIH